MKKLILVSVILVLIGCKAKIAAPTIVKLAPTEVDATQRNKAYELGKRVLNSCNTSRFKPFTTAEATPQIIQNTTPEKITRTCQKFAVKYGKFNDLRLVEVIHDKSQNTMTYRYKADYQWKHTQKELRVTMNQDNKVAAIKSTNWTDEYQP